MEEGIRKIGKIGEFDIYFDKYVEDNSFLIGGKGGESQQYFMIGSTEDLEKYKQALLLYREQR
jgi:hypothetical protein